MRSGDFRPIIPGYHDFARVIRNYSAVTGACLMIRRTVFEEIAGFDEAFDISYNDVDLCLRLRQRGYLVVYTPMPCFTIISRHRGATTMPSRTLRYEGMLRARWRMLLAG